MHKSRMDFLEAVQELGFSGFVLIFFITAFAGVVLETVFCLFTKGVLESRTGMVIGPFNQVYGIGGVLLTLFLLPVARFGSVAVFFTGAVVGGLFEAACSFVQEKVFGTISWRYAGQPLALFGGRTSVLFMLFWGVLSVLYMRFAFPWLFQLVERVPYRGVVSVVVCVFLCFNMLLSALAVGRWGQRQVGGTPATGVAVWLDRHYPDERMRRIYPSMEPAGEREGEYERIDLY